MPRRTRHRNDGLRKLCECSRRAWPKCRHSWYLNFKWNGTHYRFSLDRQLGKPVEGKIEAERAAEQFRVQIRAGEFGQPTPRAEMTLRQLGEVYQERVVAVEHADTADAYRWQLNAIMETPVPRPVGGTASLGDWRLDDIVTDTIERYREARRKQGAGVAGVNRHLARLRAVFNWAVRVGYVDRSPFKRGTEPVIKLGDEPSRTRRLQAGEEDALLGACSPWLRQVVTAAIDTGMRRGELLSPQWGQVEGCLVTMSGTDVKIDWTRTAALFLPAGKTKTKRDRRVPISSRLRALLEMRRTDPAGKPLAADKYVFGTELGHRIHDFKRTWHTAVLRAHGHTPQYTKTSQLTAKSRAALQEIDLHFHDLRREAGSRWLDGGVPLHTVRDWLGHTNIAQTSTYLAGTMQTQHDAMRQFEERQAGLQQLATPGGKRHRRRQRTAEAMVN